MFYNRWMILIYVRSVGLTASVALSSLLQSTIMALVAVPAGGYAGDVSSVAPFSEKNMFGGTYRNYESSTRQSTVEKTYSDMHINQTVAFVKGMREKWMKFDKGEYTIMEAIELLDELVDDSDPDVDIPNSIHDFQTAERIREQWPGEEYDWFHLVGLLHDMGKVMALPKIAGDDILEQWAVVGDTFPVGCAFAEDAVVFPESFQANPDYNHPIYGSKFGIYKPGCGISNLMLSWGHDEYMYQMLKFNGCTLPECGLNMIRLHSFYPWHDKRAYTHFECPEDAETLKWIKEFNKFDLYSKGDALPDVEKLKPYYASLLKKYNIDGKLKWWGPDCWGSQSSRMLKRRLLGPMKSQGCIHLDLCILPFDFLLCTPHPRDSTVALSHLGHSDRLTSHHLRILEIFWSFDPFEICLLAGRQIIQQNMLQISANSYSVYCWTQKNRTWMVLEASLRPCTLTLHEIGQFVLQRPQDFCIERFRKSFCDLSKQPDCDALMAVIVHDACSYESCCAATT